jgi:hypothetical protein
MNEIDPASRPPLIPRLESIRARVMASRESAAAVCDGLSDDAFNRRPAPDEWSVRECLDHLVVVGEKLCEAIDVAIERAHREGRLSRGGYRIGRIEGWFVARASETDPSPRSRLRTFRLYEPSGAESVTNVLRAYTALQNNLVERIEAANGLDLGGIKITSPATRWVRMSLGAWLEMIAGHQERHLAQARRARARIEKA